MHHDVGELRDFYARPLGIAVRRLLASRLRARWRSVAGETVIGLGPAAPREFVDTIATGDILAPLIATQRGGVHRIEDGLPSIRNVRMGRPASGRGWIGLTPRNAFEVRDVRLTPLLPAWLVLLLSGLFIIGAWMREGQR